MTKHSKIRMALLIAILNLILAALFMYGSTYQEKPAVTPSAAQDDIDKKASSVPPAKTLEDWAQQYKDIKLIDAHNHSASNRAYDWKLDMIWDKYGVDRIVLFGNVSEPSAVGTDKITWKAYQQYPERFIPFASGIHLLEPSGLKAAKDYLEQGYFGLGELAIASTYSEALAHSIWKTEHPMDGILPDLYALCAEYKAPILMHIDPPQGIPMLKLEEAAKKYPDTIFIFAHANAYNSPENVRSLLREHPNVYADFFAGFTAFNPSSAYKLEDFVPIIKEFPDRFLLSTDSGYGLTSEENAIQAMYMLLDALDDPELINKIAFGNIERLIRDQPITRSQLAAVRQLENRTGKKYDTANLSKEEASKLLLEAGQPLPGTEDE